MMNNILTYIFLGIIQGLTEFLPVSSSGHLVLASSLLSISSPGVLFETILHLGTTAAVIYYFRNKIKDFDLGKIKLLIIGSIPAGLVGILFKSLIEDLFTSITVVAVALLVTAIMNFYTDKFSGQRRKIDILDAITIGLAQAFAIIPGISRSGSTIFAGSYAGLRKDEVAYFSFILSIPAIIGANMIELVSYGVDLQVNLVLYLAGFAAAFLTGIMAIEMVMRFLLARNFKIFTIYCAIVGLIALLV